MYRHNRIGPFHILDTEITPYENDTLNPSTPPALYPCMETATLGGTPDAIAQIFYQTPSGVWPSNTALSWAVALAPISTLNNPHARAVLLQLSGCVTASHSVDNLFLWWIGTKVDAPQQGPVLSNGPDKIFYLPNRAGNLNGFCDEVVISDLMSGSLSSDFIMFGCTILNVGQTERNVDAYRVDLSARYAMSEIDTIDKAR